MTIFGMTLHKFISGSILWIVITVLSVAGFMNVGEMRQYSGISIRFDGPVNGEDAYRLRRHSIDRRSHGDDVFWPSFWHETRVDVKTEHRNFNTACIVYSGDAGLIWNTDYTDGTAPGVTDGYGCAISSALAHALWGSDDVTGKSLEVDGEKRVVRGVFKGDKPMLLLSVSDEDTGPGFTSVELYGGPSSPDRNDVIGFFASAGIKTPDVILLAGPTSIASLISMLPLIILVLFVLIKIGIKIHKYKIAFFIAVFFLFLVFALALPGLLESVPLRMIPSRFSDFAFWGSLLDQFFLDIGEYLKLTPRSRDIIYTTLFYKQIGILFFSVIFVMLICLRTDSIINKKMIAGG